MLAIALTWLSVEMTPTTPIWRIVLPLTATGRRHGVHLVAVGGDRDPQSAAADVAGAGSGVYNATRQVGSVLGSASMAAFMTTRISAEMPLAADGPRRRRLAVTQLPGFLHEPFAAAMSQSLLLPAFVALFGVVAALFLLGFAPAARGASAARPRRRVLGRRRLRRRRPLRRVHRDARRSRAGHRQSPRPPLPIVPVPPADDVRAVDDEGDTEPIVVRHWGHHPRRAGGASAHASRGHLA